MIITWIFWEEIWLHRHALCACVRACVFVLCAKFQHFSTLKHPRDGDGKKLCQSICKVPKHMSATHLLNGSIKIACSACISILVDNNYIHKLIGSMFSAQLQLFIDTMALARQNNYLGLAYRFVSLHFECMAKCLVCVGGGDGGGDSSCCCMCAKKLNAF